MVHSPDAKTGTASSRNRHPTTRGWTRRPHTSINMRDHEMQARDTRVNASQSIGVLLRLWSFYGKSQSVEYETLPLCIARHQPLELLASIGVTLSRSMLWHDTLRELDGRSPFSLLRVGHGGSCPSCNPCTRARRPGGLGI